MPINNAYFRHQFITDFRKTIWYSSYWIGLRAPLKIHFGGQANLFDSGRRQEKAALASTKADFPSLPEYKNLLLSAQKQLLEPPLMSWISQQLLKSTDKKMWLFAISSPHDGGSFVFYRSKVL